jgi:S-adenosylmethionine:tRNA ribosyltransferase-isomerase
MKITDFDYLLPENLIAKRPLKERGSSRLLVVHRDGIIEHRMFSDIIAYLNAGDMLIVNNTKVFPARLTGMRENGKPLEILLVKSLAKDTWEVLSKGRYTGGLIFSDDFSAELKNGEVARFCYSGSFMENIWKYGSMPLPPYIKRLPDTSDKKTYQTAYAKQEGSIAAPTAGLHFNNSLLEKIKLKGIILRELTLHVGVGTFKMIRTEYVEEHSMDSEYFEIPGSLFTEIDIVRASGRKVFAVGTTTTRALEGYTSGNCSITSQNGRLRGVTGMFIYPGYAFKAIDSLITNFHLPRSTPLMLASALCGRKTLLKSYKEAAAIGYRFLSYGDAMLIL